jgi:hypothetical protein
MHGGLFRNQVVGRQRQVDVAISASEAWICRAKSREVAAQVRVLATRSEARVNRERFMTIPSPNRPDELSLKRYKPRTRFWRVEACEWFAEFEECLGPPIFVGKKERPIPVGPIKGDSRASL